MVYQSHLMSLSPQDIGKLGKGMILTIRKGQIGHGTPVFLNGIQAAQARRGGDIRLRMNRSQFRHNLRRGGGIWDAFKEHALPGLINFGKDQLKKHAPVLGNKLLDKLQGSDKLQGKKAQSVLNFARKNFNKLVDPGGKDTPKTVTASSKPPPVPPRPYPPPSKKAPPVPPRPYPPRPKKSGGAPFGTMGASVTYRRGGAPMGTMGASVTSRRRRGGSFRLAGGSFMLA